VEGVFIVVYADGIPAATPVEEEEEEEASG
jgi:hypothetical protein